MRIRRILAKLFFCDLDTLNNVLLHIPAGSFTVYASHLSGWLALIFGLGFIIYQLDEQKVINDRCYPDIQGWLWGICFGIVGLGIIRFIW